MRAHGRRLLTLRLNGMNKTAVGFVFSFKKFKLKISVQFSAFPKKN